MPESAGESGPVRAGGTYDTPASLLDRLRQSQQPIDWERFVRLYTPLLCHWASRLGLREPDVADFVQDVFMLLVRKLPRFEYDSQKRFRGWLWKVTLNRLRENKRRWHLKAHQQDGAFWRQLAASEGPDALTEAEYRQYVIHRMLEILKDDFETTTWKAFWECVMNDRPGTEVARELGITENAVYLAKGRVLRRLRVELAGLLD
jgi:RNA polymerase sigma-70 factor (ECF subfamily)